MFVAALLIGAISLQLFTPTQLSDESAPSERSAKAVADALNGALRTSANPQATLDAFAQAIGTSGTIRFQPSGTSQPSHPPVEVQTPIGRVPRWFMDLIRIPEVGASFPIRMEGKEVGELIFEPDLSADIFEKWIGFVAIASSAVVLTLLTGLIASFTAGAVLRPLQDLGQGLSRMRGGDYEQLISPSGPPEIRQSAEEANELARTLSRLSQDNRGLLRRIVSLQDDERGDMARELHDELGPLLFGIRANTVALIEAIPHGNAQLAASAEGILQSVEALQQANRRILDRLRPLYIQELGLKRSVETLLQYARAQAPGLELVSQIDGRLNTIEGLLSQTVYRVIQESLTNVLRHARAGSASVEASMNGEELIVEVSDDGIGFPEHCVFGRGLTGMQERARALSGTLELVREDGWTIVRCRLPLGDG
ncbi:histidine kinase [Bradyrhizobium sp. BRP22]|uniref:histidine kinase n=1 Tax=Bradyrhizobium sp. BRP22 TaxID=2793821 RepID=UPI0031FBBD8D